MIGNVPVRRPATANAPPVLNRAVPSLAETPDQRAGDHPNTAAQPVGNSNPARQKKTAMQFQLLEQMRLKKIEPKAVPQPSKSGFPAVTLNGEVSVAPSRQTDDDSPPQSVDCCHLALMFAGHSGKKSQLMSTFSTKDGIREKFDGQWTKTDVAYEKAVRDAAPDCMHLVRNDQLGGYLTAVATALNDAHEDGGPSQANCLLLTANHVMALHVERKSKDGGSYFAAKLYDPNDTANYKRVVQPTPEGLASLELKDMMIRPELVDVYAGANGAPLSMVAISLDHRLQPPMDRSAAAPSADNMHMALACGLPHEVSRMTQAAAGLAHEALVELLQSKSTQEGAPGLHRALQDGHTAASSAFYATLLASNLSNDEKFNLLEAKRDDGAPGLLAALFGNHKETVETFVQAVMKSTLSDGQKVDLLAAKWPDEYGDAPAHAVASSHGQTEAAQAFHAAVMASSLPQHAKNDLLRS